MQESRESEEADLAIELVSFFCVRDSHGLGSNRYVRECVVWAYQMASSKQDLVAQMYSLHCTFCAKTVL